MTFMNPQGYGIKGDEPLVHRRSNRNVEMTCYCSKDPSKRKMNSGSKIRF